MVTNIREKKLTIHVLSLFLMLYPIVEGISNSVLPIGTKYLGFLVAGVWLLDLLYHHTMRIGSKVGLFLVYTAWGAVSVAWSVYEPGSINRVMGYVQVFILYYIIYDIVKSRETLIKLIKSYVIGVCILSLTALVNVVTQTTYYGDRFTAMGQDPNYFGVWLASIIPLSYFLYLETKLKKYLFIAVVSVPLVVATSSRAALIALAVIGLGYIYISLKSLKKTLLMGLVLSVFLVLIYRIVPEEAINRLIQSSSDLTGSGRTIIWEQAWQLGAANPLLGHGAGSFSYLSYGGYYAHNTFLSHWAELGIFGTLLWTILWFTHYRSVSRLKLQGVDKILKLGLICAMVVNLIGALTLNWEIQKSIFIVWGFAAVLPRCVVAEPKVRNEMLPKKQFYSNQNTAINLSKI